MGYQDDYSPEEAHLAIIRLQETTTRNITDGLPDGIMGSSQKLILGHSSWTSRETSRPGTGYPQRKKAIYP